MRALCSCVLLAACSFTPPSSSSVPDGAATGDDAPDIDPDAPPVGPYARAIDIVDAKITGGPHASFPMLLAVTHDDLKHTSAGGEVLHEQGFDIGVFADAARTQRLAHEVERYSPATGELIAWVKVPSLSAATTIFVGYADPAITTNREDRPGVWTAGYAGVWHLENVADATTQNATTDNNTATAGGQIENARAFSAGDSLDAPASASLDDVFDGGGTAEAWFFATGAGGAGFGRLFDKGTGSTVAIGMCDATVDRAFLFGHAFENNAVNWCTQAQTIAFGAWTHVAVVYDATSADPPQIYLNGELRSLSTGGTPSGARRSDAGAPLTIGNRLDRQRSFAGILDEARLARVARDAGWIATTHENQREPTAFYTLGPRQ
jgi:hypothetical protein